MWFNVHVNIFGHVETVIITTSLSSANLDYWSIALQMEHCFFGNNIESKIGILNLVRKIYVNPNTLTKSMFLKFVYVFINAGIE